MTRKWLRFCLSSLFGNLITRCGGDSRVFADGDGNYFGGDDSDANRTRRYAVYDKWPGGRVPYTISDSYKEWQKAMIAKAMKDITLDTCVNFVKKEEKDTDYVSIAPTGGCRSVVGPSRNKGKQELSLASGCFQRGTILHELMHTLGFHHEQQRSDRDLYVDIYWNSIRSDFKDGYKKIDGQFSYNLGYDYESIMHYSSWEGCTCRWLWYKTMTRVDNGKPIYEPTELSVGDYKKIQTHYRCDGRETRPTVPYKPDHQ